MNTCFLIFSLCKGWKEKNLSYHCTILTALFIDSSKTLEINFLILKDFFFNKDNRMNIYPLSYLPILFSVFFLSVISSSGQTEEQLKELKKAEQNYKNGEYGEALKSYLPLLETLDENTVLQYNLNYKVGFCYYASAPEDSFAVPYFRKYLETSDIHFEAYYFLGNISASGHEFDSAISHFNKFKEFVESNTELSNSGLSEQIIEIADRQIAKSEFAKFLVSHPGCASLESLTGGANTVYSEYAPVINPDETRLAFTRRSPETLGGRVSDDGDFFEDIFISQMSSMTMPLETDSYGNPVGDATMETILFSPPVNMGQRVNTEGHEGAVQFSADGKKFYIYRKSNIWVSEMKKKQTPYITKNWKKARRQKQIKGVLRPKTYEPSVYISTDGNVIYFSSERPGGFGGLDLYKSERGTDGKWSAPVNLGESINTPADEDAPFIGPDGTTLYFSSKGHSNMGDYDIFVSEFTGDGWTSPLNMGYPINSASDDIFYTVSAQSGTGFFSSNRSGGFGLMDIYKATFPANTLPVAAITGTILASDSAPAFVNIGFAENGKPGDSVLVTTDSLTGNFTFPAKFGKTYLVSIYDKGYEPYHDTSTVPELVYFCQQYKDTLTVFLRRIKKDTLPPVDSLLLFSADSIPAFPDSAAIADSIARVQLEETLKKAAPEGVLFRIQVGAYKNSHTTKIYENLPELKVISFEDGYTRYFSGAFSTIEEAREGKEEIIKEGFSDAFIVAFRNNEKIPLPGAIKKK